jgi:hypothetical protein
MQVATQSVAAASEDLYVSMGSRRGMVASTTGIQASEVDVWSVNWPTLMKEVLCVCI